MKTMKRIATLIMAITMLVALVNPATVEAAQKVKLNKKKATLTITDKKKNPTVTLKVKNTTKKAKWSTSNKKVAKVSNGKVIAKGVGKATITCKVNGKKLTCEITVKDKICDHSYEKYWKAHWKTYEYEEVVYTFTDNYACVCGVFHSETESENHLPKYAPTDIQKKIGLHGTSTKIISCSFDRIESDSMGRGQRLVKYHVEYIDYLDCTLCGAHIVAKDTADLYQ